MQIGIVTQPLNGNFGGILQNYALQQVLIELGHKPITLDYQWNHKWYTYLPSLCKKLIHNIFLKKHESFPVFYPHRKNNKKHFFIEAYIRKTNEYVYRYRQFLLNKYHIKAIIVGSDQVWRPLYNPDLKDMFLRFVKDRTIKKIAYAASFGTKEQEYTKKEINQCKPLIKKFNAISVREKSGEKLLNDYFQIKAQTVLDPTMLLRADDYIRLLNIKRSLRPNSIVSYILDQTKEKDNIIKMICESLDIDNLISLNIDDDDLSPINWLEKIYNANYVITDSFHGTVFSLIFHKPFISILNDSRGIDRFVSLLEPLKLTSRIATNEADLKTVIKQPIDWSFVDTKIEEQKKKSIDFLEAALKGIK